LLPAQVLCADKELGPTIRAISFCNLFFLVCGSPDNFLTFHLMESATPQLDEEDFVFVQAGEVPWQLLRIRESPQQVKDVSGDSYWVFLLDVVGAQDQVYCIIC